jgi:hypothetical protein
MQTTRKTSAPILSQDFGDGRAGNLTVSPLLGKSRGFANLAADDVTNNDNDNAEQERNSPAPRSELVFWHEMRKGQEDPKRQELPSLRPLDGEACEVAASTKRCVFKNHGAGTGKLSCNGEPLNEPENDEHDRRPDADLLIRGQDSHAHRRNTH